MEPRESVSEEMELDRGPGGGRRRRRLMRLALLILLSAAVLAVEAGLVYSKVVFSSPFVNAKATAIPIWGEGGLTVQKVLDPAVAAGGLRAGDRIRAVILPGGRTIVVKGAADGARIARAVRFGEPFQIQVERSVPGGGSRVVTVTYPAIPPSARLAITTRLAAMASDLVIFLACLAAALLIGLSRPEDEGALAASLLFLCFASLTWHGDFGLFPSLYEAAGYVLWIVLYAFVTPALLWFCLRFPSPSPIDDRLPWLKRAGVAFGLTFAAWNGLLLYLQQLDQDAYLQYLEAVRYADWVLDILFCLLAVVGVAALVLNLRGARGQDERRRLGILLAGILGLFPWLLSYLYAVTLGGSSRLWVGLVVSLAMLLFPVAFIYAVLRHRVFGIRVFLRRGLQFALLSKGFLALEGAAIFVALYYAAGPSLVSIAGEDHAGVMAVAVGGLTLASVLGIRQVNGRLLVPVERRFFREAYDAREILTELTVRVRRLVGDPDALAASAVEALSSTLHPREAALFLRADALSALPLTGDRRGSIRQAASASTPSAFLCFWRKGAVGDAVAAPPLPLVLQGDAAVLGFLHAAPATPGPLNLDPKDRLSAAHLLARQGTQEERHLLEKLLGARLLVPLSVGSDLLGLFCLGEKLSEEPYSREDLQLLSALAQQMADTLDHARLLHRSEEEGQLRREVEIAQQVQQNLLPRAPAPIPGLDCAAACRPARYVGGDYYDFIRRGESSVGLALGDISGKGVSAALLMASLQATLREQAETHGDRVSAIMAGVNRRLCDSAGEGRFATLFYGVLDTGARALVYANAGHNPPMLLRWAAGGTEVLRLPATGTIVGVFPEQRYGQRHLALRQGDVLVLFSDGVTEAMNEAGEFFEEERLQELLVSMPGRPASEIRDRVLDEVARFSGSAPQADDITLVVARLL